MDHPEKGVRSESSRPAPGESASRQAASIELAVFLVRSLFCGLPRLEKRMAVFVSASDESDGGCHRSRFWHGGWVAPEKDWVTYFAPARQERVLDVEPSIPFLNATDMRDPGTIIHEKPVSTRWLGLLGAAFP
jgi:hypothetical protein